MKYSVAGVVLGFLAAGASWAQVPVSQQGVRPDFEQGLLRNILVDLQFGSHISDYEAKAQGGDQDSLLIMAVAYSEGIGLKPDKTKALDYARRAAASGSVRALGLICLLDKPEDKTRFPGTCQTAVDRDVPEGRLARIMWHAFSDKPKVPRNAVMTKQLLDEEVSRGLPDARMLLSVLLQSGLVYPKNDAAAVIQTKLAADAGLKDAISEMASRYEAGQGVPKDPAKAKEMHVKLARLSDNLGLNYVAQRLLTGDGFEKNPALGAELYNVSATQGDITAMLELVKIRLDKTSPYYSVVEAEKSLKQYEEADDSLWATDIYLALGRHYRDGDGVPRNLQMASAYFSKCAADDSQCAFDLAQAYEAGSNIGEALKWYHTAQELGESAATTKIAEHTPPPAVVYTTRPVAPPAPIKKAAPVGTTPPVQRAFDFGEEITRYINAVVLERGYEVKPQDGWFTELVTPHPFGGIAWHTFRSATDVKCAKLTAASYKCSYNYNKMVRPDPKSLTAQFAFVGLKASGSDEVTYRRTDVFTLSKNRLASASLKAWMNTPISQGSQSSYGSSNGTNGYVPKQPDFRETWNGYMCATTTDPCGY